MNNDKA